MDGDVVHVVRAAQQVREMVGGGEERLRHGSRGLVLDVSQERRHGGKTVGGLAGEMLVARIHVVLGSLGYGHLSGRKNWKGGPLFF